MSPPRDDNDGLCRHLSAGASPLEHERLCPAAPTPTRAPQVTDDAQGAPAAAQGWLGAALLALAAGVAALSLLGPLVTGVIEYRISDLIFSQLLGLDALSLALVAPVAAWRAF